LRKISPVRRIALLALALLLLPPAAAARTLVLEPGSGFRVEDTDILCTFGGRKGTAGALACRIEGEDGPRAGSYLFGLNQASLGVSRFLASGDDEPVLRRRQPRTHPTPLLEETVVSARIAGTLRPGDRVRLAASDVRCKVARGAAFEGWVGVACRVAPHGRDLGGSFAPALDDRGFVVRRLGKGARIVFRREHGA
jgi:hypothetical protein